MIAGAVVSLLALINNLVGSFGLQPFWSDTLVSSVLLLTTVHWGTSVWSEVSRKEAVETLDGVEMRRVGFKVLWHKIRLSFGVLIILLSLFVWSAMPLFVHSLRRDWRVCGSFPTSCEQKTCLRFLDGRGRQVIGECVPFDDDSGYKDFPAPNWWTYRPDQVALVCNGLSSEPIQLEKSFFDGHCAGQIGR